MRSHGIWLCFVLLVLAGCGTKTSKIQANLPECVSSDCNCSDFATQEEAQAVLDAFPGDPHKLDNYGSFGVMVTNVYFATNL